MSRARTLPRTRIHYVLDWRDEPMATWVHVRQPANEANEATYAPPAPTKHGHAGYAVLCVAFGTHELRFSSPAQLDDAIRVLAMNPLPTSLRMARARAALDPAPVPARGARRRAPMPGVIGLNNHWLSRLPVSIKSAKARPRVVEALRSVRAAMVRGDGFVAAPPD